MVLGHGAAGVPEPEFGNIAQSPRSFDKVAAMPEDNVATRDRPQRRQTSILLSIAATAGLLYFFRTVIWPFVLALPSRF